jgi:hypothetical protein
MRALSLAYYVRCWINTNASLDTLAHLSPLEDIVLQGERQQLIEVDDLTIKYVRSKNDIPMLHDCRAAVESA